ncbi:MAG: ATP-binding cassette domain-containing protein [Candidatus Eremiobacteraeota bacterium]|nr:ATP-binding cassette domain-containing protein [Candidatus Eremiobacteraeota bacterium]MBV8223078.1 ATP-binding cassette domain-containing protein [Candidatus Eremiobacteraeota bacterium]
MSALAIAALTKSYTRHLLDGKRSVVLRNIDLALEPGTFTVINGPSGAGKSSLLRCIYRSALPDSGRIDLRTNGATVDIAAADERTVLRMRREHLAMTTQFLSVVPRVSALDLVRAQGVDRAGAVELLASLGLPPDLHGVPPATFSGGQRQMINLAIVLARSRPLLLLDEVTASLDPTRRNAVLQALLARKHAGVTMLGVFHDPPKMPGLVDRVLTLRDGTLHAA